MHDRPGCGRRLPASSRSGRVGEWTHEGGYHYYPKAEQVRAWLAEGGFAIADQARGDGYHHYICQLFVSQTPQLRHAVDKEQQA